MGLRILLVDDDPTTLKLVRSMLEAEGHTVRVHSSWHLVPPALFSEHFDLALVDVLLPGVQGDDLVKRLKETGPGRRVPLVLVSAMPTPELERAAAAAHADGWLHKPLTPESLRQLLEHLASEPAD